jgi:hypothetical protein
MARNIDNPAQTKLRFFVFQDIITCVTGVLIFIVLLMTVNIGGTSDAVEVNPRLVAELKQLLDKLNQINISNGELQREVTDAQAMPSMDSLNAEIASLNGNLQTQAQMATKLTHDIQSLGQAETAKESTLGLTDLRAEINKLDAEVSRMRGANDAAAQEMAALEEQVKQQESRLLQAENDANKLWVIPEAADTTKEPVLVVVSGHSITMERFNKKGSRVELPDDHWKSEFEESLKNFNHLNQYLVLYLKPSGITRFEDLLDIAKGGDFEIGYDALEETQDVQFSAPDSQP